MQHADNLNGVREHTIKYQVVLELLNTPNPCTFKKWVGIRANFANEWKVLEKLYGSIKSLKKANSSLSTM